MILIDVVRVYFPGFLKLSIPLNLKHDQLDIVPIFLSPKQVRSNKDAFKGGDKDFFNFSLNFFKKFLIFFNG